MSFRIVPFVVFCALMLTSAGCSLLSWQQRPAWRDETEKICLAEGFAKPSAYLEPSSTINGPGVCGLLQPFKVTGLLDGAVRLRTRETMGCPMIAALNAWLADWVEPVAEGRFGSKVVAIETMGAYACRRIDNEPWTNLSEHAFGNALDVSGFVLEDGRVLNVQHEFRSTDPQTRAFFQDVAVGACQFFTTVLAPGSDTFHYNHMHLDLAWRGHQRGAKGTRAMNQQQSLRRICKPVLTMSTTPLPAQFAQTDMGAAGVNGGLPSQHFGEVPQTPPAEIATRASPRQYGETAQPARGEDYDPYAKAEMPEGNQEDWDLKTTRAW